MEERLKILLLEDVITDAELVRIELNRAGISYELKHVKTEEDFRVELADFCPGIVLADYWLPSFDGISALEIVRALQPGLPFIFVSGAIGEDLATETLRRGATDYVSKDHLSRLAPAVRRALKEREEQDKRQQAEAALRESEARYRMVFTSAASIILLLDRDRVIVDCNPPARVLFGSEPNELLGRDLATLAHPEDAAGLSRALDGLSSGAVHHQCRLVGRDQRVVDVRINASVMPEGPAHSIVLIEDVTERKRLENLVQQAQKLEAIGRLAGGVAHDFNNLLTVIENCCERLLSSLPNSDRRREDVLEIRHAGGFAASLTRRLLSFSNRDVVVSEKLELSALAREALPLLQRMLGSEVTLASNIPVDDLWVEADRGQLEQVLLNLAANARDAMPGGGTVTIEIDRATHDPDRARELGVSPGDYARLRVCDCGSGIRVADHHHIFEPFFTTKDDGSAGLGLSTIYGIVRQAGGTIGFQSEPDRGTVFEVHLPLVEPPATRPPVADEDDFSGAETVLVVEDEEVVRRVVNLILSPWGYQVIEATCGDQAMEIWRERASEIELVITDIVMPGMSGREMVQRMQAERPGLKSIYISGHAEELVGRRETDEEFNFLYKPFSSEAMLKKVRSLLDRVPSPATPRPIN